MSKRPTLGDRFGEVLKAVKDSLPSGNAESPEVARGNESRNAPQSRLGVSASSWKSDKRPVPIHVRAPGSRREPAKETRPARPISHKTDSKKPAERGEKARRNGEKPPRLSASEQAAFKSAAPIARPPVVPQPPRLSAVQHLRQVSARIEHLRIRSEESDPVAGRVLDAVDEPAERQGALAILGLDFGTAFTKAVVGWKNRHFAVDWSSVVRGANPYLVPSVFSENQQGVIVLGARAGSAWTRYEGIKLRLLSAAGTPSNEAMCDGVVFVALAFRHANRWLRATQPSATSAQIRWQLHLGLPTASWDDLATTAIFRTLARAARVLACTKGPVTRQGAADALRIAETVGRPAVDVLPEFACQVFSYLSSPQRQGDLHAIVDIGAGTVDMALFNVHERDGEEVLAIFSAQVEKLGAHYLLAALAGHAGEQLDWLDAEASLDDSVVARKTSEQEVVVRARRGHYLNSVGTAFNETFQQAISKYPNAPVLRRGAPMSLFLCGGGGRIDCLEGRMNEIASQSRSFYQATIRVVDLVRPRNIEGDFGEHFDRLSVAYGLSHLSANIARVVRRGDLEPYFPAARSEGRDRDDDR